ncbi:acyltransferase [Rhodococcus antarcticus]|uniref:Acyltransferase n=1 Tax=Rhodococcus antarcticus TaxID=2987751 RepID=A0ABY6P025_9NOCA|nr:acyltransferase [Rhodococcus antarcticus]UZJ24568.1 acyltransferase [Rhodococcus antarcticus]
MPQRTDIQGLRALAVGLVIVYHLLPDRLSGGFVGVDVFFVISGYLIIGTLHREVVRTGRIDLPAFYARRVRRLVPAATVVLVATVVLTVLLLPVSRWRPVALDVAASALQVQNWALAYGSTDYAAATQAVSPLQHYWSLAVEEQFYLVTPVVMVLAVALAARNKRVPAPRAAVGAVLLLGATSFVYSVLHSWSDPAQAYFVTTTRMWELVLGGALAMAPVRPWVPGVARIVLGWAGLALVLGAALTFTTSSAFPGWIALLPTMGTAMVLFSGSAATGASAPGSVGALLSVRPATWIGDISYSLYLWHWPVLVFYLAASDRESPDDLGVVMVLALSLVAAAWSARTVENRFRHVRPRPPPCPTDRCRAPCGSSCLRSGWASSWWRCHCSRRPGRGSTPSTGSATSRPAACSTPTTRVRWPWTPWTHGRCRRAWPSCPTRQWRPRTCRS